MSKQVREQCIQCIEALRCGMERLEALPRGSLSEKAQMGHRRAIVDLQRIAEAVNFDLKRVHDQDSEDFAMARMLGLIEGLITLEEAISESIEESEA